MENAVAGLVLFLCFSFFMFQAGYQWREWSGTVRNEGSRPGHRRDDRLRDSMIGKL
jgi:hypothetical protein